MEQNTCLVVSWTLSYLIVLLKLGKFTHGGNFWLTKGVFIDRSRINHTETYSFHAQITAVSHKITAKLRFSVLNITSFDKDITFRRVHGAEKNSFPRPGRALAMSASSRSQNPLRIT